MTQDAEDAAACIVTREDGSIWCTKCNVSLGNKWNKTVKVREREDEGGEVSPNQVFYILIKTITIIKDYNTYIFD